METYEPLEIEVVEFDAEDVITASNCGYDPDASETATGEIQ